MIKARRRRGQIDRDLSFGDRLLTVDEAAERCGNIVKGNKSNPAPSIGVRLAKGGDF